MSNALPKVVEAYYTPADLAALWRFSERKIRDLVKEGNFTLRNALGVTTAEPMEVAGEIRIPASAINAYAASHAYNYSPGIKARNQAELLRKIKQPEG